MTTAPSSPRPSPSHRDAAQDTGGAVSHASQRCLNAACGRVYAVGDVLTACPTCGELLDVVYDWPKAWAASGVPGGRVNSFAYFLREGAGAECSGVWQFRELFPFYRETADIVSIGEGKTILQRADMLAAELGFAPVKAGGAGGGGLFLQYEGMNPSGSFKDNGMTAGFTHAKMVGAKVVACASTGNTSASLAVFAMQSGIRAYVFIGDGKIAFGKLSQALDYGATTLQVAGDFDACLKRVREIAENPSSGVYLLNSVNPFRLEGQKSIMCRVLRDLGVGRGPDGGLTNIPDWIVVPGGNLGNCAAFGKAFIELRALGLIQKVPRLAVINAAGARTLDRVYNELGVRWKPKGGQGVDDLLAGTYDRAAVKGEYARMDAAHENAHTVASAIEINRPVNLPKALRALWFMDGEAGGGGGAEGVVRSVDDETILEHKAMVGRYGLGCEPASAASVAGAHRLLDEGVIKPTDRVVCVLTGHQLKDPDATVTYHTGIDTKAAQAEIGPEHRRPPTGRMSNPPIRVADEIGAIMAAMGLKA